jgi:hypothetical protein
MMSPSFPRAAAEDCLEVADLREERAAAEVRSRLESRKATLRAQINKLRERGGTLPADPVAELFAWLSGGQLEVRDIVFGFPLVFAFLIEIVSAFGPAGIVAYAEVTRRTFGQKAAPSQPEMASAGELLPALAGSGPHSRVVEWMADRTEPTDDPAATSVEDLHADYQLWCLGRREEAQSLAAFAHEFDRVREVPQLADRIRKFGGRYYGIRLVSSNVKRLPARTK